MIALGAIGGFNRRVDRIMRIERVRFSRNTPDLFTEISRDLDKALWFLEAHEAAR